MLMKWTDYSWLTCISTALQNSVSQARSIILNISGCSAPGTTRQLYLTWTRNFSASFITLDWLPMLVRYRGPWEKSPQPELATLCIVPPTFLRIRQRESTHVANRLSPLSPSASSTSLVGTSTQGSTCLLVYRDVQHLGSRDEYLLHDPAISLPSSTALARRTSKRGSPCLSVS